MKITTWNVNSLTARLARAEAWLHSNQSDVLCLQELKLETHKFPHDVFAALGYRAAVYGQKTYAEKLTAAGFRNVRIESLWEKVYPPLHRFMQKPGYLKRFHPLTRIQLYGLSLLDPKIVYSAFDYVIATADKAG